MNNPINQPGNVMPIPPTGGAGSAPGAVPGVPPQAQGQAPQQSPFVQDATAAAYAVQFVTGLAWQSAQNLFKDAAKPEHAISLANVILDEIGRLEEMRRQYEEHMQNEAERHENERSGR
jgi:hypothetical protein